MKTYYYPITE